jgi:hypothetical protein
MKFSIKLAGIFVTVGWRFVFDMLEASEPLDLTPTFVDYIATVGLLYSFFIASARAHGKEMSL